MSQIIRFKDVEKLDKKQLQQLGAQHSQWILDEGFDDATVLMVKSRKALEYITAFIKGLDYETRAQLTSDPESYSDIMGASLSLSSTGARLAYETDAKYSRLSQRLKDRKGLLDLAFKSMDEVKDSDGDTVEKVKIKTQSKETLMVKL